MKPSTLTSLALALAALLLASCQRETENFMVGTLERDRIELKVESSEPIVSIDVRDGQAVVPGDLVLTQDPARARQRLQQLAGLRDQAAARLAELQRGPREETIREARANLEDAAMKLGNNQLAGFKPAKIRDAHIAARKIGRLADQLLILGEPAGADFQLRVEELDRQISDVIKEALKHSSVTAGIARDRAVAMKTASSRAQRLPAIGTLAKQGTWEEAERNVYKIIDEVSSMSIWYQYEDRVKMLKPFVVVQTAIDKAMKKQRVKVAQDALEKAV